MCDAPVTRAVMSKRAGLERLGPSIVKLNRQCSIHNRLRLAHQLIEPLFEYRSIAALVGVETVGGAW